MPEHRTLESSIGTCFTFAGGLIVICPPFSAMAAQSGGPHSWAHLGGKRPYAASSYWLAA